MKRGSGEENNVSIKIIGAGVAKIVDENVEKREQRVFNTISQKVANYHTETSAHLNP